MRRMVIAWLVPIALFGMRGDAGEKGQRTPPAGFVALFDGKSLNGWKNAGEVWSVVDGVLHYNGKKPAKNLATDKDYADFEFYVDWKIEKAGDSGIYLRGQPQVQIWDSYNLPAALAKGEDAGKGSGGIWNNPKGSPGKVPLVNADNPVGQWNTFYIKMVGDRVTIKLNDKLVVDDAPFLPLGKAPPRTGTIELQTHGDPLWFRNVFVREVK